MHSLEGACRCAPESVTLFKYTDALARYDPCSPYPGNGRFGDGSHKTVYAAQSAEAAVAEYLRRHPELLSLQDDLVIRLWEMSIEIHGERLDLTHSACQTRAGISEERLRSSESDERVRYAECRALANEAETVGLVGLCYPSAATTWFAVNHVFFGEQGIASWQCHEHHEIERPQISAESVSVLR